MYNEHFELRGNPFNPAPSRDFIFRSVELKEALAHFRYALENREAFLLLTGEVGTGKTTAVQALLYHLPEGTPVAVVTHTTLEPRELLEDIASRFGAAVEPGASKPALVRALETFFEDQWRAGRQAILILDEAHLLSVPVLEEVRLLSNLEREGGKLVQICLVGQPELLANLHRSELRQLRQRISVRYALRPLSPGETADYVVHRLRVAGSPRPEGVFTEDAVTALHEMTHGIPREINVVAGQAMLTAYLQQSSVVNAGHVRSVKEDYGFEGLTVPQETGTVAPGPSPPPPPPPPPIPPEAFEAPPEEETAPRPPRRPIPLPPDHLRPEPLLRPVREPAPRPAPDPTPGSASGAVPTTASGAAPPPHPPRSSGATRSEPRDPSLLPKEPPPPPSEPPGPARDISPRSAPVRLASGPGMAASGDESSRSARGPWWILAVLVILAVLAFIAWKGGYFSGGASGREAGGPAQIADSATRSREGANSETGRAPAEEPTGSSEASNPAGGEKRFRGEGVIPSPASSPEVRPVASSVSDSALTDSTGSVPVDPLAGRVAVLPSVADPAFSGAVTAQIASFRSQAMAERVLADLEQRTGLRGAVLAAQVGERQWYRILLGRFGSAPEAENALRPLLRDRTISEIVIQPVSPGLREQLTNH